MISVKFGTTRTVLLFSKLAFKFPSFSEWRLFLLGLLANMQEVKFSKTGWPELCPVYFSLPGGFLNVMARVEPLSREDFNKLDLDSWVKKDNYIVPAEIKMDSFGWLNGKLVAVDYGN